jgi:hypothetical protein
LNYTDFGEIIEDDFTGSLFGIESQIKVLGQVAHDGSVKMYLVKCFSCAKDPELHGEGIFKSFKYSLIKGQVPCGCSVSYRKTEGHYRVLCQRTADLLGYSFLGWATEFSDRKTKLVLECSMHGVWSTGIINNFLNRHVGCPKCKAVDVGKRFKICEKEFLSSLISKGFFPEGTLLSRSDQLDKRGHKPFLNIYCPDCNSWAITTLPSLKKGCRSCDCSKHRQKEAYINFIFDGSNLLAIKFGIANNTESRLKDHVKNSVLNITNHLIYTFSSTENCKFAEKLCKQTLVCGIVDEQLFGDGYTETTFPYNIDKIVSIYGDYGGVLTYRSDYESCN